MAAIKKISVVFYAAENSGEPVRDWLRGLPKEDRIRAGEDIRTVELGWPIGMPVCRPLGGGIYEVRSTLKDRIARVLFAIEGQDMVLLHGFIKKTREHPSKSSIWLASVGRCSKRGSDGDVKKEPTPGLSLRRLS